VVLWYHEPTQVCDPSADVMSVILNLGSGIYPIETVKNPDDEHIGGQRQTLQEAVEARLTHSAVCVHTIEVLQ